MTSAKIHIFSEIQASINKKRNIQSIKILRIRKICRSSSDHREEIIIQDKFFIYQELEN